MYDKNCIMYIYVVDKTGNKIYFNSTPYNFYGQDECFILLISE